jgi:hypothetical protein
MHGVVAHHGPTVAPGPGTHRCTERLEREPVCPDSRKEDYFRQGLVLQRGFEM